jgi:hypothetical protein
MRNLHPDVAVTAREVVIKENEGFRLRMEKWQSINPKDLFSVDLIQESLDQDGKVIQSSTYNFNMTADELKTLAQGIVA